MIVIMLGNPATKPLPIVPHRQRGSEHTDTLYTCTGTCLLTRLCIVATIRYFIVCFSSSAQATGAIN